MKRDAKIYIAGHENMIGAAIFRSLQESGYANIVVKDSLAINLTNQQQVQDFFMEEKPEYVFLAATKVGGILANSKYPAEFSYYNLQVQTNIIHSAWKACAKKLLFLGSSCMYPKNCPQPMREDDLLTGKLEPTSEPYAIAKIAGATMCHAYNSQYGTHFTCVIPSDLYGPGDDFNPETGHVLAALISKMHHARVNGEKQVAVWGTGKPIREFLYIDDFAKACIFLMNKYDDNKCINVGSNHTVSIRELVNLVRSIIGFDGNIVFDPTKPDGMPRKTLESKRINELGWKPVISLEDGIKRTYSYFQ